jgi:hypothetical protein
MTGPIATGERGAADVVKAVGAVIALLAGSVALLYTAGGAAMTLRLFLYGLPSLNVAAQLPREILISVALIQIVLPAIAVGSAYALVRLLLGRTASPPRRFVTRRGWGTWLGAAVVLALATTLLGAAPAFARGTAFPWRLAGVVAIVFAISVLIMLVVLKLRAEVADRADGWNTLSAAGAMTLIVALAAVPACFLFAGTFRLLDAKVCTAGDTARSGRLIGELSDRIYLGETEEDDWDEAEVPLRVVSIPKSEVEQMLIGSKPDTGGC